MRSRGRPGVPRHGGRPLANLRVAIVHDWLTGMRGGEAVLEAIARVFPTAPIRTLVHVPGAVSQTIEAHAIRPAALMRWLPWRARFYRQYLPLFPGVIETMDLDDFDLVVSTSHCAAKAVVAAGRATHICYCHSPMRYAWDQYEQYFGPDRLGRPASTVLRPVIAWLARWDRATAGRVDRFLANSQHVAGRIARYYNRESRVLYPPVDTEYFTPVASSPDAYYLVVSALVPYKRVDLAIGAANQLGVPLKIVGTGPDRDRLVRLSGPTVEFLGSVEREQLRDLYRGSQALVHPAEEDFGIAPVEAMACGRPVVALSRGGAAESVLPGVTGLLASEATVAAFADAMAAVPSAAFAPSDARARAETFSIARFDAEFRAVLTETLAASAVC